MTDRPRQVGNLRVVNRHFLVIQREIAADVGPICRGGFSRRLGKATDGG
jgi:hypothetical protein